MAKDYKKIYEEQFGKSNSPSQLQKNQKSINNLKAQLTVGGVDPNEALDKRNFIEKKLNLTPNQNAIFDIFEILNRPQQALFGGIESVQKDEDFSEGAKQGIKGNKKTQFKDILMNTGAFDDTTFNEASKETDSKLGALLKSIDLVDVLGAAGDIFLDPMDIPLIPVSTASKAAKAVDTATDIAKTADKAMDTADNAIKLISPTQAVGKLAKGAIKTGAGVADTTLEKALTKIDETKGVKYVNPTSKWATEIGKIGDDTGLLETYKGFKNNLTNMFNTKLSKTARQSKKLEDAKEAMTRAWLEDNYNQIRPVFEQAAEKLGKTVEEVDRDVNKIVDVVNTLPMETIIRSAKDGTIKYTDEIKNKLIDMAADAPDEYDLLVNGIKKGKNGVLDLSEDWDKVIDKLDPGKLEEQVQRASFLTAKEQKEIEELTKLYEQNAPEAVNAIRDFYNNGNNFIAERFGTMKNLGKKFNESNLEGFSKHKVSDTYNENIKKLSEFGVSPNDIQEQLLANNGAIGTGSKALNTRKYNMSAQEANILKKRQLLSLPGLSKEGKDFIKNNVDLFDTTASAGLQSYINQMPRLAKNSQLMNEIFLEQGLGDLNKISALKTSIKEGKDVVKNTEELSKLLDNSPFRLVEKGKAPYGFKKLEGETKDYIVNFLKSTGKKSGNNKMVKMAQHLNGLDGIAINPTVLNLIKVSTNTTNNSEFAKVYNKLMNFFKGNATASVTNQMNNITGNMSNMYLSGMSMKDIAKYSTQASKDLSNWEDILKKGLTDVSQLTEDELKTYNRLKGFQENVNLLDNNSILKKYDIDGVMESMKNKKGPIASYVKFFGDLNAKEDRLFKYATYLKAMDDPSFVKNLGIENIDELGKVLTKEQQAGKAVGKILFDPTDLTSFEQKTMRNIIPFYNYAKKNLAFQITNMGDNLQKYNKFMKTYNTLKNSYGDDYDNMADYFKDNMYIPVPGIDKNGNYTFIRTQLPVADLIDFTNDPLNNLVNKSNPLIKSIYENVSNVNTLTGADIEKFPGQKTSDLKLLEHIEDKLGLGNDLLPTKKQQQLFGNLTGLNAQARQWDRLYEGMKDDGVLGGITRQFIEEKSVDTDRLNKSYEEIEDLQNLMKQYEQKGYQFSTISELKKANKNNTIAGIDAILAKYGVGEKTTYNTGNKYYDYYMNNYR